MKICLISVEIFAWGKYGGFGRATRTIGRELAKRGIDVCAVVPKREGQKSIERLDGITVYGFSPARPWQASNFLKACNADIYHSCEPSLASYLALKSMPHKKHMATVRDPRDFWDWKKEFELPSLNRFQVIFNYFFEIIHNMPFCNAVFPFDKLFRPVLESEMPHPERISFKKPRLFGSFPM